MTWGTGTAKRGQSINARKVGSLLRRATVKAGDYTESSNRKSRAKALPEGLQRFFRKVGD